MPPASSSTKSARKVTGLRYWMLRVLDECDRVRADFASDPVHDLRVSLRRCRSMADGLIAMDPDPDWKAMKKTGKRLFQRLGALRDVHVMIEWIEKLHPAEGKAGPSGTKISVARAPSPAWPQSAQDSGNIGHTPAAEDRNEGQNYDPRDPAAHALLQILARREAEQKLEALAALEEFDRKQWRQWAKSLPQRAGRIRPGSALFKHLALERWTEGRHLHQLALRHRSQTALHSLRIGIKRFRYIVENFLPAEHQAWNRDLKKMQDLLGEVHDLDVLWATAVSAQIFPDADSRLRWREKILAERNERIASYRAAMTGPEALWSVWRAALPQGKQIQTLATRRMKLWANALDPDFAHSERVAPLALQLHDGLLAAGLLRSTLGSNNSTADGKNAGARSSLLAAALLHDVGKSMGNKGHHKTSLELIKAHGTPLGWKPEDMQRAALVARFHCGALPTRRHKALRDLLPAEQELTIQLAAILRLANACDASHDGHIRRIQIENAKIEAATRRNKNGANGFRLKTSSRLANNQAIVIAAEGYTASSFTAQAIAAERHLLETVLHRPVMVRPMKNKAPRFVARQIH
ncbi:MAG: CHAD domain-containing protein [Candidatus Sulfotelmatobacter sp.]